MISVRNYRQPINFLYTAEFFSITKHPDLSVWKELNPLCTPRHAILLANSSARLRKWELLYTCVNKAANDAYRFLSFIYHDSRQLIYQHRYHYLGRKYTQNDFAQTKSIAGYLNDVISIDKVVDGFRPFPRKTCLTSAGLQKIKDARAQIKGLVAKTSLSKLMHCKQTQDRVKKFKRELIDPHYYTILNPDNIGVIRHLMNLSLSLVNQLHRHFQASLGFTGADVLKQAKQIIKDHR